MLLAELVAQVTIPEPLGKGLGSEMCTGTYRNPVNNEGPVGIQAILCWVWCSGTYATPARTGCIVRTSGNDTSTVGLRIGMNDVLAVNRSDLSETTCGGLASHANDHLLFSNATTNTCNDCRRA